MVMQPNRGRGHVLLLTGPPGIGKTTVIRRVAEALGGRRLGGFLTEEVRERGQRVGFRLVPLCSAAEKAKVFAHVGFQKPTRVGRYRVDVALLNALMIPALAQDNDAQICLVDEIGKMECLSPRFVSGMRALLEGPRPLVATVAAKGGGLIAEVKTRNDCVLWEATRENRDVLSSQVLQWLEQVAPAGNDR
jgi:nucleoside-triphosphatase